MRIRHFYMNCGTHYYVRWESTHLWDTGISNNYPKLKIKTKSTQLSKEISYHLTHPLTTERTKIPKREKHNLLHATSNRLYIQ